MKKYILSIILGLFIYCGCIKEKSFEDIIIKQNDSIQKPDTTKKINIILEDPDSINININIDI